MLSVGLCHRIPACGGRLPPRIGAQRCPAHRGTIRATLYLFPALEGLRRPPTSKKSFSRERRVPFEWHFSTVSSSTAQSKRHVTWSPLTESNRRPSPYICDLSGSSSAPNRQGCLLTPADSRSGTAHGPSGPGLPAAMALGPRSICDTRCRRAHSRPLSSDGQTVLILARTRQGHPVLSSHLS
jgi:hypothetical protein